MAYISCKILWQSEFDNIVSRKDKMQDLNINQIKLEVHDNYEEDEKITKTFEPGNDEDVLNQAYLDKKVFEEDGHLSLLEKDYNDFKILSNKQSIEKVLKRRAMKTTIEKLYDKGLFHNYNSAHEVLKHFFGHKKTKTWFRRK